MAEISAQSGIIRLQRERSSEDFCGGSAIAVCEYGTGQRTANIAATWSLFQGLHERRASSRSVVRFQTYKAQICSKIDKVGRQLEAGFKRCESLACPSN